MSGIPTPRISIIIAVLNGAATLERCIESICSQSWPNKEVIVIDGGSTDGTIRILEKKTDQIAYWESGQDKGIYHAWNKALPYASGDWICFLGSDDYFWEKDVLTKTAPSLEIAERRKIRLVYGRLAVVGKGGKVHGFVGEPWDKDMGVMTHKMPPHPGMLHHTDFFRDHGGFDESFRIAADYEIMLRELADRDAMFVPEVVVAAIQQGGVSCNIRQIGRLIVEDIRARKMNGMKPITVYALKYYIVTLKNTLLNAVFRNIM